MENRAKQLETNISAFSMFNCDMLLKNSPTRLHDLGRLGIQLIYMSLHLHSSMMIPPLLNRYTFLVFLLFSNWVYSEDDVRCLKGVKNSLTDPEGKLSSWSFSNTSAGFICKFSGLSCWNDNENRVLSMELRDFSLTGKIPDSLQYCHSLQTLDLSGNRLSGSILPQICTWLPYLVSLDLSRNDLTGGIPVGLVNCTYLNNLILDDNKLSGNIPDEFSNLRRMKKLSVANNDLSGRVPAFKYGTLELNVEGNSGLCDGRCGGWRSKASLAIIVAAGVAGALFSILLGLCLRWWCNYRESKIEQNV